MTSASKQSTYIFLYAYETWTITAELQRKMQATELRCYRKILHISYNDRVTKGSPCQDPAGNRTTRSSSDHRKETQTAVVWTCLPFIRSGQNYLARHSDRGRRQSRQKKRWEDNIREWTGLEFAKFQRAVENREKWRKLVVKTSVVPQPPLRLSDR